MHIIYTLAKKGEGESMKKVLRKISLKMIAVIRAVIKEEKEIMGRYFSQNESSYILSLASIRIHLL